MHVYTNLKENFMSVKSAVQINSFLTLFRVFHKNLSSRAKEGNLKKKIVFLDGWMDGWMSE